MGDFLLNLHAIINLHTMKNCLFILMIMMTLGISRSVAQFVNDVNGKPVREIRYTNINGSPFYDVKYLKGAVRLVGNVKETAAFIQYDQIGDIVLVKNKINDDPIEIIDKLAEFRLELANGDTVVFKSLPSLEGYYEVLYNGPTSFYKRTKKKITDVQVYNSASIEKSVNSSTTYHLLTKNKQIVQIKLDKKDFLSVLSDKAKALSDYISKERINFKTPTDVSKLLAYYDSLK